MSKKKKASHKIEKQKEVYPHFRFLKYKEGPPNNKRRHPKLILEKENDTFHYMGMTESRKRGKHTNIPLSKNPLKGDSRPAYIRKEYLIRSKKDFGGIRSDYVLSLDDRETILKEAQRLKAKKKK